jgi:hypothetical protein
MAACGWGVIMRRVLWVRIKPLPISGVGSSFD